MQIFIIAILGAAGVLSRYFIDQSFAKWGLAFPFSTLTINSIGSFLIGFLFICGTQYFSKDLSSALMIGFLGGFTTFSAFSLQTVNLIEQKQFAYAFLYFGASPVLGVVCASIGVWCARAALTH